MGMLRRGKAGSNKADPRVGFAVVGLGHIAQVAVLPAFQHAHNARLVALCSGDDAKLRELSARYRGTRTYTYEQYDQCLEDPDVDAVYIALPNELHREYTERAAERGVHVLCEKPMATTEEDCQAMIDAAGRGGVRLMIAYRLHFEEATLKTIEICQSGQIGEARFFSSDFCQQVRPDNIRTRADLGGGPLYDIGIYCINAARSIFGSEPEEVFATCASRPDERFAEVDEMVSVVLRFPQQRLATFTCSFGAEHVSTLRVVGTRGDLRLEPAYSYSEDLVRYLTIDGRTRVRRFRRRDQFAPELIELADCVLRGRDPAPSGREGLLDVRVIQALQRSLELGRGVPLAPLSPAERPPRPSLEQEQRQPPVQPPEPVHAEAPH